MYRNAHVHNLISETSATLHNKEIHMEIEKKQELVTDSLEERDKYLMENNPEDLENTSDKRNSIGY